MYWISGTKKQICSITVRPLRGALIKSRSVISGNIAADIISVLIVADAIYGAEMQREFMISWLQILLGGLALFALFIHRITEFVIGKEGITIIQKIEAAAALGAAEASRPDETGTEVESPKERAQRIANVVNDATKDKGLAGKSIL